MGIRGCIYVVLGALLIFAFRQWDRATGAVVGIAVSVILVGVIEMFSGLIADSERNLEARWLRIGKLLQSMWGDGGWQVSSAEALRLQVLAHLEAQLRNSGSPSLPLARCLVLQAAQIERDFHFPLVPVTDEGQSRMRLVASAGNVG
jgi:hypothetical protein